MLVQPSKSNSGITEKKSPRGGTYRSASGRRRGFDPLPSCRRLPTPLQLAVEDRAGLSAVHPALGLDPLYRDHEPFPGSFFGHALIALQPRSPSIPTTKLIILGQRFGQKLRHVYDTVVSESKYPISFRQDDHGQFEVTVQGEHTLDKNTGHLIRLRPAFGEFDVAHELCHALMSARGFPEAGSPRLRKPNQKGAELGVILKNSMTHQEVNRYLEEFSYNEKVTGYYWDKNLNLTVGLDASLRELGIYESLKYGLHILELLLTDKLDNKVRSRLVQDLPKPFREALNSNSHVYRFLCFFKIIEGILNRRARLGVKAKKTGASFSRPAEVLPSKPEEYVPWLNAIFPVRGEWDAMALDSIFRKGVIGRKIKYVIDNELYPLRVEIAHALFSESGEPTLYADELLHVERVNKWLPLTKCIARRMLKNEFPGEFLSYLREDGSIAPH